MDLALADKTVVITGASGGIGRALAEAFAAEGSRLVLHGHSQVEGLRAWLAEQPWRDRALVVAADVGDAAAVSSALRQGAEHFGRLDACVANAGAWPPADQPLHVMEPARMEATVRTNLLGATWTARAFMAELARSGPRDDGHGASLVFTGSTAGRFGERAHADYALAKAGLVGLVQTLKHELVDLDPWARVNLVEPGWTVTHMARPALSQPGTLARIVQTMPLKQVGRARDVAAVIVGLSSPVMGRHVSGQTVTVAGGMEGRVRWQPDEVDEDAVRARLEQD